MVFRMVIPLPTFSLFVINEWQRMARFLGEVHLYQARMGATDDLDRGREGGTGSLSAKMRGLGKDASLLAT